LNKLQTFVDLLAVTSGLVAVLHFFVPNSVLDWADRAILNCLSWLERHRYGEFRKRLRQGHCDRLILWTGSVLLLLNSVLSTIFKIAMDSYIVSSMTVYFLSQLFVFVFSFFAFYRFGVPLVRWIFAGEQNWLTLLKTAFGLMLATIAGIATFIVGAASQGVDQTGPRNVEFLELLETAGPFFGYVYVTLFVASGMAITALAAFIANGVVSTVMVLFLYFVIFMWAAWAIVSALAFVLNRSLQRKGIAVLLASVSTLLSAIMHFHSN